MENQPMQNLDDLRFVANCSLLFTELPLLQRPAAAKAAGFEAIEFWWPFASPVPADKQVDEFVAAVSEAGVWLCGLNFYAGDLAGQDCGAVSVPALSQAFRDNIDVATGIGGQLGVSVFNALYGNRVEGVRESDQDELAVENLVIAADAAARIGAAILIEAVSGPKPYPLRTADHAIDVVDRAHRAAAENVSFLFDIYHLAANGDDIATVIEQHSARIGHVQIADHPGRGEPGSGALDIGRYLDQLQAAGYGGLVALEYKPTTATLESLEWLPRQARGRSMVRRSGDSG
jgi:hydroxypyruvate isomerase